MSLECRPLGIVRMKDGAVVVSVVDLISRMLEVKQTSFDHDLRYLTSSERGTAVLDCVWRCAVFMSTNCAVGIVL